MSGFRPCRITTISASSIRQPLLACGVCILPIRGLGSLAKVFRYFVGAVVSHRAKNELSMISVAINLFKKTQITKSFVDAIQIRSTKNIGLPIDCFHDKQSLSYTDTIVYLILRLELAFALLGCCFSRPVHFTMFYKVIRWANSPSKLCLLNLRMKSIFRLK